MKSISRNIVFSIIILLIVAECDINNKESNEEIVSPGLKPRDPNKKYNPVECSSFPMTTSLKQIDVYQNDKLLYFVTIKYNVITSPKCRVDRIGISNDPQVIQDIFFDRNKSPQKILLRFYRQDPITLTPENPEDDVSVENFGVLTGGGYRIVPTWE